MAALIVRSNCIVPPVPSELLHTATKAGGISGLRLGLRRGLVDHLTRCVSETVLTVRCGPPDPYDS